MTYDREVDVLCAGSGAGGLAAAITAAQAGASVLVAEKDALLGGVQALSSGQVWLGGNAYARAAGIEDSEGSGAGVYGYALARAGGCRLARSLRCGAARGDGVFRGTGGHPVSGGARCAGLLLPGAAQLPRRGPVFEVLPFPASTLGEWAARCRTSPYGHGYSYVTSNEFAAMQMGKGPFVGDILAQRVAADERCAGAGLAGWMLKSALDRGVEFLTESPVSRLIVEDGCVKGAVVTTPQGELRVRARRGVVLATSGYDWNADLVKLHETMPGAGSMSPPSVAGDHFALAADAGAVPVPAARRRRRQSSLATKCRARKFTATCRSACWCRGSHAPSS